MTHSQFTDIMVMLGLILTVLIAIAVMLLIITDRILKGK